MKPYAIFLTLLCMTSLAAGDDGWKAGAASVKITPEKFMWMSGYAARTRPADSTLLDLYAKALALRDSKGHGILLITIDTVGIGRDLSLQVRERLANATGLAKSDIAICTSHTHSGPALPSNLPVMAPKDPAQLALIDEFGRALEEKLVNVGTQAVGRLAPASVTYGIGQAEFAKNRRNNKEKDIVELMNKGQLRGPFDHDLPVLAVRTADGALIAVVFGYACHATVLSGYAWCGDWPGYAQAAIEAAHTGTIAMFSAGCGADQNPLPRRTVAYAQQYGREAADGVEAVLRGSDMKPIAGSVATSYAEIPLPFAPQPTRSELEERAKSKDVYVARLAKLLLAQLDAGKSLPTTYPYPVETWKLGSLTWVILGGEVTVEYSLRFKAELGKQTWVSAYSNDVMAYIPSHKVLTEGGYEGLTSMVYYGHPSPWAPAVEDMIVAEAERQTRGK